MMKKIVFLLIFTLSLISCQAPREYIKYVSKKENIDAPKTKNVLIIASDKVLLNEFTKTYQKNYEDDTDFTRSYLNQLTKEMKQRNIFSDVRMDSETLNYDRLDSNTTDYVIQLSNFEINNRVEWRNSAMGVNGMQTSTSVEFCVMSVKVEIYDAKTNKEILDFIVFGEESVFLFDFTKTFEKAKAASILHIINYLESGKVVYKEPLFN